MKTGFIGAGKVGFSLGKMFAESGLPLTGYYSRQREAAQEAAALPEHAHTVISASWCRTVMRFF